MNRRLFVKTLYLLLAAALLLPAGILGPPSIRAAGENLVGNPGFELGDNGWEKWGSPLVTSSEKHSGDYSLHVKRNTGGASAAVAVVPGKEYRISLWVKFAASGVSSHTISMDSFGTEQGQQGLHFSGSTEWERREILYTPAAGVQHIRLSFWNATSSDYYIDDAEIRENVDIEPPSAPGPWEAERRPDFIRLTWTEATDDMGVVSYELSYKKTDEAAWNTVSIAHQQGVSEYEYTLEELEPYSVYALKLVARDAVGNASQSLIGLETTPGPNLVVNPGFETGSVQPWEVWTSLETTTDQPHSGQYALRIKHKTGGGTAKIAAQADTSYLIGYWSRFAAPPVDWFGLDVSFFGPTETRIPVWPAVSQEWTYTENELRSGAGVQLMRLAVWNNTEVDMYMDDVFIGQLPELPESLAPSAPGNAAVEAADGVSAALSWEASNGPFGIETYELAYRKNGDAAWSTLTIAAEPGQAAIAYRLEQLSPETGYDIRIRAIGENGLASEAAALTAATTAMLPVTPNASTEAAALLDRLYATSGNGIITGQHNYYEHPTEWSDEAARLTGYYPGLWGSDFAYYTGGDLSALRQDMIDAAIEQDGNGTVVTLTFHQIRPTDAATAGWESVTADMTEAQMTEMVTPGTPLYHQWLTQIDEIAGYLAQLRDAGVPVLWRPYHEMNAEFFWWGARPELFRQLWINMYERFVDYHGLNNLIWVWSPNAESSWAYDSEPYYPGHDYVDVLAMDIYNNDYRDAYYAKLVRLSGGRPIAIGENGELPSTQLLLSRQQRYVYMMTWANYLTDKNSISAIQEFYSHPYAINNGETGNGPYIPPVLDRYTIDDFEGYGGSNGALRDKWRRNDSGNALTVSLAASGEPGDGNYMLQYDYTIGNPGYAGAYRTMGTQWPGAEAIEFWLLPDGSGRQLAIQFHESNGEVWEAGYALTGTAPVLVRLPFDQFVKPGWSTEGNGILEVNSIKEFAIYIAQGGGAPGSGTLYLDDIAAIRLPVEE